MSNNFLVNFVNRIVENRFLHSVRVIDKNWCKSNKVPLFSASPHRSHRNRLRFVHSVAVSLGRQQVSFYRSDSSYISCNTYCSSTNLQEFTRKMPEGTPFERLPQNVKPINYKLMLEPDLQTLTFEGKVSIEIEVLTPTADIVLNAVDLKFLKTSLEDKTTSLVPTKISPPTEDGTVKFSFENPIKPGAYTFAIKYQGEINDKLKGLYRSTYTDENGKEAYAAVTQFEATDARRCFPCWDEPAIKATFEISLLVPKPFIALSNMPVKSTEPADDNVVYHFEKTPIMSTYLVAVVMGEFDYVEDKTSDGILVRVYTRKGKKEQGLFSLEVATKVLPYYTQYFKIAYPLPKIDLVAVSDFSAGAMENWGLVTYRETCLLVDPENSSAVSKQWIALVVGHELAHQWFGNLVTMEWWTHLWLNEGYAQFNQFLCVDYLFPEFDIWKQFVNDCYIRSLELDSLKNSHPIEVPVENPTDIDEIFDDISYNKGASVIRMLHHYIGEEHFREGLHLYLTRHQYKNTFTEDLWAALEEVSKKPVGAVMSTWTKQMGFPVVTVSSSATSDGKGVKLNLSQSKYIADGSKASDNILWMIPISISTSSNPGKEVITTVLNTKQAEVLIPDVSPNNWIKINPGTIGFYRTKYTPEMLERFVPAIQNKTLPPLDRLGLLDDLFALVKAGHTSTVDVLKLLRAFEDETDYNVWSSISNILTKLGQLLGHSSSTDAAYKNYQMKLLTKVHNRLGWSKKPGETHLDTLLRGVVLGQMSWLHHDDNIKEARELFKDHVNSTKVLSADVRSACYKTVLRAGGKDEFEALMKLCRSADLHEEKDRIRKAFGAAKDPELLRKALDFSMSDEVRLQDMVSVIASVAQTKLGRDLAWDYCKKNWDLVLEKQSGYLLTRLVKYVTESFASEEMAVEISQFFVDHKSPGTERTVQQAVETIRLNTAWLKRDKDAIQTYLNSI